MSKAKSNKNDIQFLNNRISELESLLNEQKLLSQQIEKRYEHYQLIADNTSDSISLLTFDENLTYLYVNATGPDEKGFQPEELIGHSFFEFVHTNDKQEILSRLRKYIAFQPVTKNNNNDFPLSDTFEFRFKTKDGDWRDLRSTVNLVDDRLLTVTKDITDLKKAYRELSKSKKYAEDLLNISSGIVLSLDQHGNITILNDNGHELLGYKKGELIGKNWFDTCIPQEFIKEVRNTFNQLLKGTLGNKSQVENIVVTRDGDKKTILWHNSLIKDNQNNILGTLSSGTDITQIKLVENAIKISEAKTKAILEVLPDLIFILSSDGRYLDYYASVEDDLYTTPENFIGKKISDVLPKNVSDQLYNKIEIVLKTGKPQLFEYSLGFPEGNRQFEIRMILSQPEEILIIVRNITERKKLEQSLIDSHAKYEDLYNNAPDMYFSVDQNGSVISVNKNGANYLGYKREELIGKKVWKVIHKKDLPRVKKQLETILNNCNQIFELEFRKVKKDGTIIFVQEDIQCHCNDKNSAKELRIVCRDISDRKRTHQKLLDYQENLKTMTYELNSVEEKMKQQIATKLHDDIGQAMALSKITLSDINKDMNYAEISKKVESAKSFITDAIKNSRDLTYELSPPILHELGLGAAIKWYVDQIRRIFDIKFQLRGIQEKQVLSDNTKILLYKSVVELINNIIKHSNASLVTISINKFKNTLRILVRDNGVGFKNFTDQKLAKNKKFGLFSINERINYIGGEFKIDTKVKKGTKITIKIPL